MAYLLVIAALTALDQVVKYWVRANLAVGESTAFLPYICQLTYVQNQGAAFSSMQGMRWFFVVFTVAFVAFALWALLTRRVKKPFGRWALTVVLAGAVGNLIDRALRGYVVDMFDVLFMNFAVFNVADIYVVCGGIALCVYLVFFTDAFDGKKEEKSGGEDSQ